LRHDFTTKVYTKDSCVNLKKIKKSYSRLIDFPSRVLNSIWTIPRSLRAELPHNLEIRHRWHRVSSPKRSIGTNWIISSAFRRSRPGAVVRQTPPPLPGKTNTPRAGRKSTNSSMLHVASRSFRYFLDIFSCRAIIIYAKEKSGQENSKRLTSLNF